MSGSCGNASPSSRVTDRTGWPPRLRRRRESVLLIGHGAPVSLDHDQGCWRIFGAVVDLTGDLVPALSVDRRNILDYKATDVERLLEDAVPVLMASDQNLLTFEWLCRLAKDMPITADLITKSAINSDRLWRIGKVTIHACTAGCCSLDAFLLSRADTSAHRDPETVRLSNDVPDWLAAWRATACGIALNVGSPAVQASCEVVEVLPAMPSDLLLMSRDLDGRPGWLDPAEPVPLGHVVRAAVRLRRRPAEVAERFAALGFVVPDVSVAPEDLTEDDALLMSRDLDGRPGWLDPAEPVPLGHVVGAAARLRRRPAEVAERLAALGFVVPDVSAVPEDLTDDDALLINRDLNDMTGYRQERWLDPAEPMPLGNVVRAAARLRRRPAEVAERLAALGFVVPDVSGAPEDFTDDDARLVSRGLEGRPGWLDPAEPVPLGHVVGAAVRLRRRPAEVAERLAALGFVVPDVSGAPEDFTDDDARLVSRGLEGRPGWLDPAEPVPLGHVVQAAVRLRRRPAEVAERLAALGFVVPDVSGAPEDLTDDDALLLRVDQPGRPRWLDPASRCRWARRSGGGAAAPSAC